MSGENTNWIKDNIISVASLSITILTIGYFGIIKGNNDSNKILELEKNDAKMEIQIQSLQDKKVDKEVFMLLQTTLAGMAIDIREIRTNQQAGKIKY